MNNRYIDNEDFYLFFSVDIINSTKMKYKNVWVTETAKFYKDFHSLFSESCQHIAYNENTISSIPSIKLWKPNGDELLFYKTLTKSLTWQPMKAKTGFAVLQLATLHHP